jgi:hypothetical protein
VDAIGLLMTGGGRPAAAEAAPAEAAGKPAPASTP